MKKFDSRVFLASLKREAGESTDSGISFAQLKELLNRKDADFIKQAYRIFLRREADISGLQGYLPRIRHLPGKIIFLASLYLSPERPTLAPWLLAGITTLRKLIHRK